MSGPRRLFLRVGFAILLGIFLLISLGISALAALPVSLITFVVLTNRTKLSQGAELLAIGTMEVALVWFVWSGLYYRAGVSPSNYLLADGIAAVLFALPLATFLITRHRVNRISLAGLVLFLFLIGTIAVPVIPLGGACTGHIGNLHCETTYGAASWLFVCAGAEYATFPGGVSTGLPIFQLSLNTSLGEYFFADCVFM